jgi:hypothetical protein
MSRTIGEQMPCISKASNVRVGAAIDAACAAQLQERRVTKSVNLDPLAPTIFHESWWLDVATGQKYAAAEVSSGGRIVGKLPYFLSRRKGLSHVIMPTLTHFLGPALIEGEGSANTRFLNRLSITRELIAKLPAASSYEIKCHAGITDVIAFQAQRFQTTVQFTHEIQPLPEQELWKRMRDKTRNVIRRAQEKYDVLQLDDAQAFVELYARNLREESYLDLSVCRHIIESCMSRNRGRILGAKNRSGDLVAANFCAWDANSSYYLMSTRGRSAGNGAGSLLVWKAILDAANRKLVFDMDGLSSEGGILFFAGFGADVRPRYIAKRFTIVGQLRQGLHTMRSRLRKAEPYYD